MESTSGREGALRSVRELRLSGAGRLRPRERPVRAARAGRGARERKEADYTAALHVLSPTRPWPRRRSGGMLDHVLHIERGATDEPLDFCQFGTSRDGGVFCASRHEGTEGPQLDARYEAIRKKSGQAIDALRHRVRSRARPSPPACCRPWRPSCSGGADDLLGRQDLLHLAVQRTGGGGDPNV